MDNLRTKVLSGIKWSAGAKAGSQLITWGSTIFVMRLLHPDDYGLIAMATVFIGLCRLINELGLGVALVQVKELTDRMKRQGFGMVLIFNVGICLILIAVTPLIADFFNEEQLRDIIPVLAIQFPILAFIVIPKAIMNREMNFKAISIVGVVTEFIQGTTTLLLAWFGFGLWSLILGSLLGTLLKAIGFNIASPFLKLPSFNFKGFKSTAKFGGFMTTTQLLWYIYSQADVFIVGKILGKTVLGYYSVAMEIASLPMQKVGSIINQVALPAYASIQDDKPKVAAYAAKTARTFSIIAFPMFFGISAVAPELIEIVLGEKWLEAILPLQLLSLIVPLRTCQISLVPAVNAMGRPEVNTKNLAIACIVMPLAFFIGVQFGLKGVAISWIVGYSVWFIFMLSQSLPILTLPLIDFLKALRAPFLVASIMYLAVFLTRLGLEMVVDNQFVIFIALIAAGGIVYGGIMWTFYKKHCLEVWALRKS